MKPQFRILEENGKFAVQYLHITKRFLLRDKKEWKPFIHYLGKPNDIFWHSSLNSLKISVAHEVVKRYS